MCNLLRLGVNFDKILLNENMQKRILLSIIMILQQLGWSYGHLLQMQSMTMK